MRYSYRKSSQFSPYIIQCERIQKFLTRSQKFRVAGKKKKSKEKKKKLKSKPFPLRGKFEIGVSILERA